MSDVMWHGKMLRNKTNAVIRSIQGRSVDIMHNEKCRAIKRMSAYSLRVPMFLISAYSLRIPIFLYIYNYQLWHDKKKRSYICVEHRTNRAMSMYLMNELDRPKCS